MHKITEAHINSSITTSTTKTNTTDKDDKYHIVKEEMKCDCNGTDNGLVKQNCANKNINNNSQFSSKNTSVTFINNDCTDNAKGDRNQVPVKVNDVSSDTILKYVYDKSEKNKEPEKSKAHFKNSLRKKRSPNNPQPFNGPKVPLTLNYETSHPPRDVELFSSLNTVPKTVQNSALADFNIETLHENKPHINQDSRNKKNIPSLEKRYLTQEIIEVTPKKEFIRNRDKKYNNFPEEPYSSIEKGEKSKSEENYDSSESRENKEYNNSDENSKHVIDNSEEDKTKYRNHKDDKLSESNESDSRENNKSKEFALYEDKQSSESSEETKNNIKDKLAYEIKSSRVHSGEEKENEDYSQESGLKKKSDYTENNKNESNEEGLIPPVKKESTYENLNNTQVSTHNISHPPIQDIDLDNFSYERIKLNKNGRVEPIKDTHEINSNESESPIHKNPEIKSENYNNLNPHSKTKDFETSSSVENNEPIHINDGEIKPVVEINSDIDSVEVIREDNKDKTEVNNENQSLETLLGVREKEDIERNNKLTDENGNVKEQFERIPLDYKHDNKKTEDNTEDTKSGLKKDKVEDKVEDTEEDTSDVNVPKDEKYDEHLNFKFDNIAIKLPDIKLPEDILDYTYEAPDYDRKDQNEPKKDRFYHYKDEESEEEQPKKNADEEEGEEEESDHDYYNRYYAEKDAKQDYKAKKKSEDEEDEEDEDLYEKFVRERFGKTGSFQKRSDKLQDIKDQPNAQLYKSLQSILQKTKEVEKEAEKSGDPKAGYIWTLEYGQNA